MSSTIMPCGNPSQQRLYCCLLFYFNFFQYVKELFDPGHLRTYFLDASVTASGDGGE